MKPKNFSFNSNDGKEIYCYKWIPDNKKITAVVHIIHGMGEYAGRYSEFAGNLAEAGFAVYALDQRGHGRTAKNPENFGHYSDKNGWETILDDLKKFTALINKQNNNTGVFLFGHSAGSFFARDFVISDNKNIKGVVLSGSAGSPGLAGYFGIIVSKYIIKKYGPKKESPLHMRLTFDKYNSYFKPNRTDSDWATRDNKKIDELIEDPYCYRLFSATFYLDLIKALFRVNDMKSIKKIPKNIPFLFLSGTHDPLGGFKKGIKKVYEKFKKAGITDVTLKFYQGARHELINELNRKEIYTDIIAWLNSKL